MKKRYFILIELAVMLAAFILLAFCCSLEKAIVIVLPLVVFVFEVNILLWICMLIFKQFKEKFDEERILFMNELGKAKEYYKEDIDG